MTDPSFFSGPVPNASGKRCAHLDVLMFKHAWLLLATLREPLTKIVKAAYRAHREQRMLKGAEQDRRLVVQVDGILAQPLSIRDAARIPAIVSKIEAMRGYH